MLESLPPLGTTGGIITYGACGLLIAYSAFSGIRLWVRTRSIQKQIDAVVSGHSSAEDQDILSSAWRDYSDTFVTQSGERQKTESRAERFFSVRHVAGHILSLRYWAAVPSILIGMGILGTFVGLVFGISDFDSTSVEGVQESVERLLGGMSAAFWSSILGMSLSIAFNFYEKHVFKRIETSLRDLTRKLDGTFFLTAADRLRFEQEDRREMMAAVFGYENEHGEVIFPGHVLRDLRRESEQQTRALKSFSSDLADGIMLATETIDALGTKLGDTFEESVRDGLGPLMAEVKDAVQQLQRERESGNEEMVQNVVARLASTLETMGQEFQQALSGGAIDQLNEVAATGSVLKDIPADLDRLMDQLQQDLLDTSQQTSAEAEAASDRMRAAAQEAANSLRQQTDSLVSALTEEVQALQERSERLIRMQSQSTEAAHASNEQMRRVLLEAKEMAERMSQAARGVDDLTSRLSSVTASLNDSTNDLDSVGKALSHSADVLKQEGVEARAEHKQYVEEMKQAVRDIRSLSEETGQQFDTIREGLSGVFHEMEQGLNRYQNQTREGLNKYLGDFAEQLENASAALGGSVEALHGTFEDLEDLIADARTRGNGRTSGSE